MMLTHILQEMIVEVTHKSESVTDADNRLEGLYETVNSFMQKAVDRNKFPGNVDMLVNIQNQVLNIIDARRLKLKETTNGEL